MEPLDPKSTRKTTPLPDDAAELQRRARASVRQVSLLVHHRDGAELIPLRPGAPVTVGRGQPAGLCVDDSSLSRAHARFAVEASAIVVTDLGSTNGTWVAGRRVERADLAVGDEVVLGGVTIVVHALAPAGESVHGLWSHERFRAALEDEVIRARHLGRKLAVVMVRAAGKQPPHVSRFSPRLLSALRPIDKAALYSADTVELLLPEAGADEAIELANSLARASIPGAPPSLLAGVAVFPEAATEPEALIERARAELLAATIEGPVRVSAARGVSDPALSGTGGEPVIESAAMRAVYDTAARLARAVIPVLIHGETGTGKEVFARRIHEKSPRRGKPLVFVNCGAIPASLLESTLFGHERGAFTGANQQQKGVFEVADGGTVLLDEIGELPLPAQVALLRVLEARRVARVGSTREVDVDVRVLAATHRDLESMVERGAFRKDLLYRLNAMTVTLPPLRDRLEDIEPLALQFLAQANRMNDCQVRAIDPAALALLRGYAWPGNVRELRNAVERGVVLARGDVIGERDLPERVQASRAPREAEPAAPVSEGGPSPLAGGPVQIKDLLARYESELLVEALRLTEGNRVEAARRLGLPIRTFNHRVTALGIKRSAYEAPKRR